jgi:hypothetical protein
LASASAYELGQTYEFAIPERELKFFDRQSEKRTLAKAMAWQ